MENKGYTEGKMKRIAVGATVAGVLLVVFLIVVLVIQVVSYGVKNREIREYDRLIEEYKQSNAAGEKELDAYMNGDALYYLALKRGWVSGGD